MMMGKMMEADEFKKHYSTHYDFTNSPAPDGAMTNLAE
jgi:hypothetical protein